MRETRTLASLVITTLTVLLLFSPPSAPYAHAAGIKATNPAVGALSGGSTSISFDIEWNKSWRNATVIGNWDAAWVFAKFRTTTGGTLGDWKHASLNNSGHSVPSGATLTTGLVDTSSSFNIASNPVVGAFIYRSSDGQGTFTANNVSLSWNYSQDGVSNTDTVEIRVFGIEMVYIPQGPFFAGDNATSRYSFRQGYADNDPWYIGSEGAITAGFGVGSGSATPTPVSGTGIGETNAEYYDPYEWYTLPAAFPKGYGKFYMMKGEISQGQWVAFFNTLTSGQRSARDITSTSNFGKGTDNLTDHNNVSWTSGDATLPDQGSGATYEGVAMAYLSWGDLTAYLDWAGLRPMSELEFEKAGRGPYRAVSGEYAWGSTTITQATSITDAGLPSETPNSTANCVYGNNANVHGPMRVGGVGLGSSTREATGSGHYGNRDLSGNVWERCVTVARSTGRSFEGRYHGDGALDGSGDPNVTTWPGTNGDGAGLRGGAWSHGDAFARLSDRVYAPTIESRRWHFRGGRGVRIAP